LLSPKNHPNLHTNLIALGTGYLGGAFLKRVADEIAQDWKPIVFGEWVKNGVRKLQNEKK
jgi:hypothetical protein